MVTCQLSHWALASLRDLSHLHGKLLCMVQFSNNLLVYSPDKYHSCVIVKTMKHLTAKKGGSFISISQIASKQTTRIDTTRQVNKTDFFFMPFNFLQIWTHPLNPIVMLNFDILLNYGDNKWDTRCLETSIHFRHDPVRRRNIPWLWFLVPWNRSIYTRYPLCILFHLLSPERAECKFSSAW